MRRSIAFTLIELLVVIAIIAILAAILFPVFAQAKVAAKKSQDLSNCKNHATAIIMYSADYDDMFPRQWYKRPNNDVWGWNTPFTWREAVMPYVKNGQQAYDDGSRRVLLAQGGIWDHPMKPGARGTYQSNRNLMPGACYWNARGSSWDCDQTDAGYPTGLPVMPSVSTTQLDAPAQIVSTLTVGINPDWN
ncbi:MAG: prepilin-type N-terminal cleavage/methylation domain-containing protein, partial [Armatimonadetes bacterium]|nr:prepilin-type N-terminal cleavage/methylation domain-containing protein [Armatimonadota bacterium]